MGSNSSYEINYQKVTASLADGTILSGQINIVPYSSLSEMITKDPRTCFVFTEVNCLVGSCPIRFVSKKDIVWIEPEE